MPTGIARRNAPVSRKWKRAWPVQAMMKCVTDETDRISLPRLPRRRLGGAWSQQTWAQQGAAKSTVSGGFATDVVVIV